MRPRASTSGQTGAVRSSSSATAEPRSSLKALGHMAMSMKIRSVMVVSTLLTFSFSTSTSSSSALAGAAARAVRITSSLRPQAAGAGYAASAGIRTWDDIILNLCAEVRRTGGRRAEGENGNRVAKFMALKEFSVN